MSLTYEYITWEYFSTNAYMQLFTFIGIMNTTLECYSSWLSSGHKSESRLIQLRDHIRWPSNSSHIDLALCLYGNPHADSNSDYDNAFIVIVAVLPKVSWIEAAEWQLIYANFFFCWNNFFFLENAAHMNL